MRHIKKSTKFQPHENRALTTNNRPSVSAPDISFQKSTLSKQYPTKPASCWLCCFCNSSF